MCPCKQTMQHTMNVGPIPKHTSHRYCGAIPSHPSLLLVASDPDTPTSPNLPVSYHMMSCIPVFSPSFHAKQKGPSCHGRAQTACPHSQPTILPLPPSFPPQAPDLPSSWRGPPYPKAFILVRGPRTPRTGCPTSPGGQSAPLSLYTAHQLYHVTCVCRGGGARTAGWCGRAVGRARGAPPRPPRLPLPSPAPRPHPRQPRRRRAGRRGGTGTRRTR